MATGLSRTLTAAEPTPYHGTPHLISTRIEAEHFDHGGQGVAYRGGGAVVTNTPIRKNDGGLFRLIYPPIPRERPDADIGVVTRSGDTNRYLALREGEWVIYSFTVPAEGYYSILFKARGPERYNLGIGFCDRGTNLFTQSRLRVEVDGEDPVELNHLPANAIQARVWMTAGAHRMKLTATRVMDLPYEHAWICDYANWGPGDWQHQLSAEAWPFYTLPIDWLRIEPSPTPLRADLLAGGTDGFTDGMGQNARFSWPKIVGETPSGELIIHDSGNKAFRLVNRSGQVRTWAGHPGNPPRAGHGTNAGFGALQHTLMKPDGTLLVLHQENDNNNFISGVTPGGDVHVMYQGQAAVPAALRDISPEYPTTDRTVSLDQLFITEDEALEAEAHYTESFFFFGGMRMHHIIYQKLARFRLAPTGELTFLSVNNDNSVRPTFEDLGEGYRLNRPEGSSQVYFVDGDDFAERVHTYVSSAYRAADGSLWSSDRHQVFQLTPDPSIRYLTVKQSPDGHVDVPEELAVSKAVEQYLRALPSRAFRVFSHWSDGNTENPRPLHLSRDTTLTPHFIIRLPEAHGIAPHSLRLHPNGRVQFDLIGPNPGEIAYPYQVEYSNDLKQWLPFTATGGTAADKPLTTVLSSTATSAPRRYYRARPVVE